MDNIFFRKYTDSSDGLLHLLMTVNSIFALGKWTLSYGSPFPPTINDEVETPWQSTKPK